jgi:hypothetical protein
MKVRTQLAQDSEHYDLYQQRLQTASLPSGPQQYIGSSDRGAADGKTLLLTRIGLASMIADAT